MYVMKLLKKKTILNKKSDKRSKSKMVDFCQKEQNLCKICKYKRYFSSLYVHMKSGKLLQRTFVDYVLYYSRYTIVDTIDFCASVFYRTQYFILDNRNKRIEACFSSDENAIISEKEAKRGKIYHSFFSSTF